MRATITDDALESMLSAGFKDGTIANVRNNNGFHFEVNGEIEIKVLSVSKGLLGFPSIELEINLYEKGGELALARIGKEILSNGDTLRLSGLNTMIECTLV